MGDSATVAELLVAFSHKIDDSRSPRVELLTQNELVMYGEEAQRRSQEGPVWPTQYEAPRAVPSFSIFESGVDFAAIESLQRQQEQQRTEDRSLWQQLTAQALQSHRAATGISTSLMTSITEPTEASEVRTQMRARSRLARSSQRIRRQHSGFVRLPSTNDGYTLLSSGYQEAALASREADVLDARDLVYSSTTPSLASAMGKAPVRLCRRIERPRYVSRSGPYAPFFFSLHMKDSWDSEHGARTGKGIALARQAVWISN